MRAYRIPEFGLDNLTIEELPSEKLGHGEVRIAVRAVALNYRDLLMVNGLYNPRQPLPLVPCSDAVGEVVEVGPGVDRVDEGDRVSGIFLQKWLSDGVEPNHLRSSLGGPLRGTLAEEIVLSQEGVVRVPDYLTDEEAATLPCAALTAWSALVTWGAAAAGESVVIQGTGGVSIFALQIASAMGLEIYLTSSSEEKMERARDLGAHHTVNYREDEDWGRTIRDMTGRWGVDHVIEVGGAGTLEQSLKAVRPGGHIALIGVLAGRKSELDLAPILMRNVRVQGVLVGSRDGFEAMNRCFAVSEIRPVVDRVFPFEDAIEAFRYMASGAHFGKVVIRT